MTADEKQRLKALFVATGVYYGHEIPDQALRLYVTDLEDLPFAEVEHAIGSLRRDPKTQRCPLPAMIRARVQPELDSESQAVLVSSEIVEAIGRVGPYRIPELSPEAMEVIRLEGGWKRLCEVVTNDNLSFYKAQWRQLAKALRVGLRESATALPDRRSSGGELTAIGELLPMRKEGA